MKYLSIITGIFLAAVCNLHAATPATVRFADESADTTKINALLSDASTQRLRSPNAWVNYFANKLIDTPYKGGTLEQSPEMLTIDMEEMDCTTYMENVLALAMTAQAGRWTWRDFINNLEALRYRGGNPDGYSSRLHYMSDWIIDNGGRGLVKDFTTAVGNPNYEIKTLDYMSKHRDSYPAMADEEEFLRIKLREDAFRGHRYPYIKKNSIKSAQLRDGDVVFITTKTEGLDVSHVGFVIMVKDKPHLLHASSKSGKVEISKLPLDEYLRKQLSATGVRVVRLSD